MRKIIVYFFVAFLLSTNLTAQVITSTGTSKFSANSQIAILSKMEKNLQPIFPTFDGYWHAFALAKPEFNLNDVQIVSVLSPRLEGFCDLNYSLIHIRFKPDVLESLLGDDNIYYLELSSRLNAPKPLNDTSRYMSMVDKVELGINNGLKQNYTGKNTIVGIVDIGFQTDHPTFFNQQGNKTKIISMWHQQHATGKRPNNFNYGSEYKDTQEILTAIDNDGTHGTHVAGIAAGSGLLSTNFKYRGMAPEAELSFVGIKYANDSLGGSALGDFVVANPTIIDGYKYLFDVGDKHQKPVVANLSWGMHTGPHDGTSLFDLSVAALVGPGKIVVGAAGNDGGNKMHIGGNLMGDTIHTLALDKSRKDYPTENVYIDAWGDPNKRFNIQISLVDTLGNVILSSKWNKVGDCLNCGAYRERINRGNDTLDIIWSEQIYPINNKPNALIMIENNNPRNKYIRVSFNAESGFHAWNSGQSYRWTSGTFSHGHRDVTFGTKYKEGSSEFSVGENGGTGSRTLSVGAYVARNKWFNFEQRLIEEPWLTPGAIAGFSSRGPAPGRGDYKSIRQKPDIIAPGHHIVSALHKNQYADWMNNQVVHKQNWRNADQYYVQFSGTSMAAPHVSGIVALYLQANPNLSPEDIKNLWRFYHTRDQYTGNDSNNTAGFGKINALDAIKFLEKFLLIKSHKTDKITIIIDTEQEELSFISETDLTTKGDFQLLDLNGREIIRRFNSDLRNPISLNLINSGIYFYKVSINGENWGGKIFIP